MSDTNNTKAQAQMSNQNFDHVIAELIELGCLVPAASMRDYINFSAPYEFKISFAAYREMLFTQYLGLLRRLFKSANLRLMRDAGFTSTDGYAEMFAGMVIIQCHSARPTVEIVCNINQRHSHVRREDVFSAFASTACYESKHNPVPIFDRRSLKVEMLPSGEWTTELEDDASILRKLSGYLMH